MPSVRELADRFYSGWLAACPLEATILGVPGHDHLMPDASEAGDDARRSRAEVDRAEALSVAGDVAATDATTLACIVEYAEQELARLDSAAVEYTVTAKPYDGPPLLLAVAARTVLPDAQAAQDYLSRLRAAGAWIDQIVERLRSGAAKGRFPVAPLVERAITWADEVLAAPVPEALTAAQPPSGWDGALEWREERDQVCTDVLKPAIGRWVEELRDLLPRARPAERAGLAYLCDGEPEYRRAIRVSTTLALGAEQLHQMGLDELAVLEQRAVQLGAELGLADLDAVHEGVRASARQRSPEEAIEAAIKAIRRAEAEAPHAFPSPFPPPCAVTPMPPAVAASGAAPHYTPPRLDGTRPGTFWFNTRSPTAGRGWELEAVAFHEAVPGHHLQFSRLQVLRDLPDLQRTMYINAFSEGWGLYAEQLAEEIGLYSSTESILGAVCAGLMRAARLVVDTGIHAFGWSRQQALEFLSAHVPAPPEFLVEEIDRYIARPGQALGYLTGKLEILRARQQAQARLGSAFSLPGFHAALLGSGSLPVPVLHQTIDSWVTAQLPNA
jgi:uncharacterized protein (DUF885 family)